MPTDGPSNGSGVDGVIKSVSITSEDGVRDGVACSSLGVQRGLQNSSSDEGNRSGASSSLIKGDDKLVDSIVEVPAQCNRRKVSQRNDISVCDLIQYLSQSLQYINSALESGNLGSHPAEGRLSAT